MHKLEKREKMHKQYNTVLNWVIICILALTWGSSFVLMKKGLMAFKPDQVAALRICLTSIVLFPLAIFHLKKINFSTFIKITISGLLGSGIPAFFYTAALQHLDSGIGGVLNTLTPLWALVLGILIFKDRPSKQQIIGIVIGFFGAVILILFKKSGVNFENLEYAFLILIATFCYGLNLNVLKNYLQGVSPVTITSIAFMCIGPIAALYLFSTNFEYVLLHHPKAMQSLFYIIVLAVGGTALATVVFYYLIQKTDALFASVTTYFIPVVAVLWAIVAHEPVGWSHAVGLLSILFGVYLVNIKKQTK